MGTESRKLEEIQGKGRFRGWGGSSLPKDACNSIQGALYSAQSKQKSTCPPMPLSTSLVSKVWTPVREIATSLVPAARRLMTSLVWRMGTSPVMMVRWFLWWMWISPVWTTTRVGWSDTYPVEPPSPFAMKEALGCMLIPHGGICLSCPNQNQRSYHVQQLTLSDSAVKNDAKAACWGCLAALAASLKGMSREFR